MTRDALIGHTGFVGGTLYRQRAFDAVFNSRNIEEIRGQSFDSVVCAGVSAVKWLANKEPDQDWRSISRLIDCLSAVRVGHFVLISTIDVYGRPIGLTEDDRPDAVGLHPYGLHRMKLEDFVAERYPSHTIVRLPALFGAGLKKNAIYDLIHCNQTDKVIANGRFQWYPTRRLAADLEQITAFGVELINVTSEPVEMGAIHARFFPDVPIGAPVVEPPLYDLRSIHDKLLGGRDGYHLDAGTVFDEMASYLAEARAAV
jgi:hypothetical protein